MQRAKYAVNESPDTDYDSEAEFSSKGARGRRERNQNSQNSTSSSEWESEDETPLARLLQNNQTNVSQCNWFMLII